MVEIERRRVGKDKLDGKGRYGRVWGWSGERET